jgi:hypothetical protein
MQVETKFLRSFKPAAMAIESMVGACAALAVGTSAGCYS